MLEIAGGIILAVALLGYATDILFLIGALAVIAIALLIFCCVVALLPEGSLSWIIAVAAGLVIARFCLNKWRARQARLAGERNCISGGNSAHRIRTGNPRRPLGRA